ncbi:hypothetical protein ACM16X_08880 [Haloarcula japonica]|uniref:hypothetical protein n=1 Tax=Haloarcula japonica TaxID=29282 RepID=UPI0039F66AF6
MELEETPSAVLQDARPLSRDDLLDEGVVKALWEEAERVDGINQTLHGVHELVRSISDTNIFRGDVAAALHHFGLEEHHPDAMSRSFWDKLRST